MSNSTSGDFRLFFSAVSLFVLRFYGPVNPMGSYRAWVMSSAVSSPNHTLLGRLSPLSG